MPSLTGRVGSLVVYAPTPEVSMLDLVLTFEDVAQDPQDLYRTVCLSLRRAAETHLRGVLQYWSVASGENASSCAFDGATASAVVDARSGCAVGADAVKVVLWFDNEGGAAARAVDLAEGAYGGKREEEEKEK